MLKQRYEIQATFLEDKEIKNRIYIISPILHSSFKTQNNFDSMKAVSHHKKYNKNKSDKSECVLIIQVI